MAQRSRRTEAYILLVLAIAINALIVYGFVTRPIVAFHLSTPLEYNGTRKIFRSTSRRGTWGAPPPASTSR